MTDSGPGPRTALYVLPPAGPTGQSSQASAAPKRSELSAILGGCCARCRSGRIFASALRMNPECPVCGVRFEREQGYFMGALYLSYGLGVPMIGALALLVHRLRPALAPATVFLVATTLFLPFVPLVFRASRVLWIHLDRAIDGRS